MMIRPTPALGLRRRALALACAGVLTSSVAYAQQPAAPTEPPKDWEGTAGLGLALTSGNSDTVNFNLAFDLTRTPKARNVMKWTGLYIRGQRDGDPIVDRTLLGYRDQYTLTSRAFVFGQIDYLRDSFKLIDYFVAPTGGVGYKLIDTETTKFSVDGGAGAVWEKNPGIEVRTSAAVIAGEKLEHQLTSTASLKHAVTAIWKADEFADGLYTISLGLATRISERVQLSIDLLDTFKDRPFTAATRKNDVALVTAVTAKF